MKKLTRSLAVLSLAAFLGFTNPVVAQSADNSTTASSTNGNDNDHDDNGKWGLLGLAGLLGLLGLRKRDDHRPTHSNPSTR